MMKKLLIAAAAMLAVACTPATVADGPPLADSPPPAAERCDAAATVDSRAICAAFETFDAALYAIDGLRDAGVLIPGSARALRVQAAIREVQAALNDASAIQRGVRRGDLLGTLDRARAAIARLRAALAS